jgi:hypothetical protein
MNANPYQPPRHQSGDTLEQKYAKKLLLVRDQPVTVLSLYRRGGKRVAFLLIYFVSAIALLAWVRLYALAFLMLGILVGTLANSLGAARQSVKFWPTQRKVLDWDKLETMARGEPLDASAQTRPNSPSVAS